MSESRAFLFFRSGQSEAGESASRILAGRDRLGGKGASLHAMAALGYRVPPGFTIPAEWSMRWHEGGGECGELREHLRQAVARFEEITGRRLGAAGSLRVAVRSGASESMPGMMDTVLDVGSYEAIERAVDQVFRSYWSARAVGYRREKGIARLGGTAVTVQEMCPADFAGVAFTIEPASGRDRVVIEAVAGLGDSLVSGAITPDRYWLERPGLEVVERVPAGARALLDGEQLRAVASCALELESRLGQPSGQPLDVEWALRDGEVWLLQARPIPRAAAADPEVRALLTREARHLSTLSAGGTALFARHNLDETLSHPTPMSWDLHRRFFRGRQGFLGLYEDLGFQPSPRVVEEGFLALIGGRVYANTDRAAEIFYGSTLLGWDHEAVRRDPSLIDEPPRDWNHGALSLSGVLRALRVTLRSAWRQRRLRALSSRSFEKRSLPEWTSWVDKEGNCDLSQLAAAELLRVLEGRIGRVFGRFPRDALLVSYLAGMAYAELEDFLERRLGSPAGGEAARTLSSSIERDLSVQQNLDLARVARGDLARDVFLERWGHRAAGEMELSRPRWREEPAAIEKLARALESATGEFETRLEARRLELRDEEARVVGILTRDGGTAAVDEFRQRLKSARALIPWRENWKQHWMRGLALVRQGLVALDGRLGLDGQVFWLDFDELRRIVAAGGAMEASLRNAVRQRHDAARVASSLSLPAVLGAEDLGRIERGETEPLETVAWSSGQDLEGTPIAAGRGAGRAWICDSPGPECPFPPPFVLVCSSTDPGWTPILARASGLIVERGGVLSHGAIVCRDFGVPAVVVPGATRRFHAGKAVRVDGDRGLVKRGVENVETVREDDVARAEPRVPPEPWVPPVRSRLPGRVALGLVTAVVASLVIVGVPAIGDAFRPAARFACDWTMDVGATPFAAIAWAAALGAALATRAGTFVVDRAQLRAMRHRIAWYRKELSRLVTRGGEKGTERAAARLVRRCRKASMERTLELMRPIGWSFLPFVLAYLWVSERFPAEPLRPGTEFEVRATFLPVRDSPLRYARLDVDEPSRVRLLDEPWKKLTPNPDHPERGPYTVVWMAEARSEGSVRLAVTARRERLEETILVTERRLFATKGITCGDGEIASLTVDYPPLHVELPGAIYRTANALSKWITSGSELDPRDLAGGPLATFLVLAVVFACFFQRCSGIR